MGNEAQGSAVAPEQFRIVTVGDWRYICANSSLTVPMWLGELKATGVTRRGEIGFAGPFRLKRASHLLSAT
jgi:hypothetical protein